MKFLRQWVLMATLGFGLCLTLSTQAWAFALNQSETLRYKISWGPLKMGEASFTYTPANAATRQPYQVVVTLNDSSALINLNSRYTSLGSHQPRPFTSQSYHALQRENDYRADKLVTFNAATKQITYTNKRDANDTTPPLPWDAASANAMRDVFSQLYAMRLAGTAALSKPQHLQVMGTKRPFTLIQQAGVKLAKPNAKAPQLWQVLLQNRNESGKLSKDTWLVTLREETAGSLTPVSIQARTRFGTFHANLR